MSNSVVGFGTDDYQVAVYIANRPPIYEYQQLDQLTALTTGEITHIGQQCGNGWRKVFNVYAKLLYALDKEQFNFASLAPTWQQYRDDFLLQTHSQTSLLFSAPQLKPLKQLQPIKQNTNHKAVHIIMGKTYAKSLVRTGVLNIELTWLNNEFAINRSQRVIVCPYFDYRQLSNVKIERLAELIKGLS
ncbi:DUF6942 family protein [Candidatus Colwellia aromaticivorans]|uniref:DUF6942 family protein n=1 Tax=Candidatus Colwellia aromaticivorans TaxID=2267621 RepID=UPI000DF3D98B|nr:hypothetical protein [Candidatus Colwellia aromaticivorans]